MKKKERSYVECVPTINTAVVVLLQNAAYSVRIHPARSGESGEEELSYLGKKALL